MTAFPADRYALALHTSSRQLGLYLTNFADDQRIQTWDLDRELSNYLHPYLKAFIAPQTWQDFAFLAIDKGPGSFTSIRMGVVTARILAQQLNIPLFTISSLAAFAWSCRENYDVNPIMAIQMEATRGKCYGAIYQFVEDSSSLITHLPDNVWLIEEWQLILQNFPHRYYLIPAPSQLGVIAPAIANLAYDRWQQGERPPWSEALPFYG